MRWDQRRQETGAPTALSFGRGRRGRARGPAWPCVCWGKGPASLVTVNSVRTCAWLAPRAPPGDRVVQAPGSPRFRLTRLTVSQVCLPQSRLGFSGWETVSCRPQADVTAHLATFSQPGFVGSLVEGAPCVWPSVPRQCAWHVDLVLVVCGVRTRGPERVSGRGPSAPGGHRWLKTSLKGRAQVLTWSCHML